MVVPGSAGEVAGNRDAEVLQECGVPCCDALPADRSLNAFAGEGADVIGWGNREAASCCRGEDGAGERMLGALFKGGGEGEDFVFRSAVEGLDGDDLGLAFG